MKMRVEATRLPTKSPMKNRDRLFAESRNSLPLLGKSLESPGASAKKNLLTTDTRLSGSFDLVQLGGLADRSIVLHPAAVCVRCSDAASVCMACCECLVDKSVLHYRRTRGKGAAALFESALVQAGAVKLGRFVLFTMWRNSFRMRRKERLRRVEMSKRRYFLKIVAPTFKGWINYTLTFKIERRDKEIGQLREKVLMLETQVLKFDRDSQILSKRNNEIEQLCHVQSDTIDSRNVSISNLNMELDVERSRTLSLVSGFQVLSSKFCFISYFVFSHSDCR